MKTAEIRKQAEADCRSTLRRQLEREPTEDELARAVRDHMRGYRDGAKVLGRSLGKTVGRRS